jgi:large subunit ribosomal protein L3
MTIGLIGKKLGMTRIHDESGSVIPVTVLQMGPCPIIQVKNLEKDGYRAVQLGFESRPDRKVNKPLTGHFKRAGVSPLRLIREFRVDNLEGYEAGQTLDLSIFEPGEMVDVTGISKGCGFAGPIKRHNSSRGPETHGSRYHRRGGSLGMSATPSHVFKGRKGAGQMGNSRVTIQNLQVVKLDPSQNLMVVRGSVPGRNDGYVMIRKSIKATGKTVPVRKTENEKNSG